jgi:hypothetical protein
LKFLVKPTQKYRYFLRAKLLAQSFTKRLICKSFYFVKRKMLDKKLFISVLGTVNFNQMALSSNSLISLVNPLKLSIEILSEHLLFGML